MSDFRAHEGWCPAGASPDGRPRLDMFPEWGDPLPLWDQTDSVGRDVSDELERDLMTWNREWESAADTGAPMADADAWLQRGERLARRVETETSAVVVVLGPERDGPARGCPHCGARRS